MEQNRSFRRLATACLAAVLTAAGGSLVPASEPDSPNGTIHSVHRASSTVIVDGDITENAWKDALTLELGYEVEPGENTDPPVRTVCKVTYDDRFVYFAFRAYDREPSKIRARLCDRDSAWHDDWVGVVLDTFNDQRRAYELFSNPLGVQNDALNDEIGDSYDTSWNAIWKSAGRITEFGYEVEMAVPFHQIRFQSAAGEQVWGFDAMRSYPRGQRHKMGLFPRERGANSYLSQTVKLVGMSGASPGRNLEIIPTLTSARTSSRESVPDGRMTAAGRDSDLGVSVRWGITPNLTLNGALNPDFSQVEADAVQLDINEQFALFFPETRPFFMEGADYFNTQIGLVHTRTIADPSAAVKFTGKQGRHTYGLFSARDQVTNLIFPGAEGSSTGSFDLETTDSVARYRFDFGGSSTVGAMATERSGEGYSSRVIGADALYRISGSDQLRMEAAASRTVYGPEVAESAGKEPDEVLQDSALVLDYLHTERGWWVNTVLSDIGDDFRADVGFRPQVGYRRYWLGGARIWWGEKGDPFNRLAWGAATVRTDRHTGDLLDERMETWVNYNGPRDSHLHVDVARKDRVHEGVEYGLVLGNMHLSVRPNRIVRLELRGGGGDWIDFTNDGPATRLYLQPGVQVHLGKHFRMEYHHTYEKLDVEGGTLFRAHVPELRVMHQLNNRIFLRGVVQYTDVRRSLPLYREDLRESLEEASRDLFAQLLFSYKVNPQTALYLGYSDSYYGNADFGLTETDRTLFLKVGYAWLL